MESSPAQLLIKVRGSGAAFRASSMALGDARLRIEPILSVPDSMRDDGRGVAGGAATWLRVQLSDVSDENPWEAAHALLGAGGKLGFAATALDEIEAIEPDVLQQWPHQNRSDPVPGTPFASSSDAERCGFDDQNSDGGKATGTGVAWNFGHDFSTLASARAAVGEHQQRILIAHLDTGYDPEHLTLPLHLRRDLQRSFVKNDPDPNDAKDRTPPGMTFMRNRGHGTGTLSLLAGNRLEGTTLGWPGFTDFLGGAPLAQVVPIRVADWVVRFTTSTMVQGFDHARVCQAQVLSMSMGGLASQALADAVNLAYEAGIVMVTAAGNNIAWTPTPKTIVFPARFRRVLAACGVMADGRAYAGLRPGAMQGNFGPDSKMATSLGAYTPNVPWAQIDCKTIVDMDGAGTSSATPQIAAAAALWLAQHFQQCQQYSQPWMRVEALRRALFVSAQKSTTRMDPTETREKIGQGGLRAAAALNELPAPEAELTKSPAAKATFPFLNLIFGHGGVTLAPDARRRAQQQMMELELTQMAQRVRAIEETVPDPDQDVAPVTVNRYLEAALDLGQPSAPLRSYLERQLARAPSVVRVPVPPASDINQPFSTPALPSQTVKRRPRRPAIPRRRLRVYALDPSLAKNLDSFGVNETVLSLPWDDDPLTREPLQPGPIGEYLEVIDVDPASNRVYEPVDLNDKRLLAQDGWPPSEGNPQFHQQMVYAVAMTTIGHFERALGRRALWAPRRLKGDGVSRPKPDEEVRRLRIYPHALRTANAYYSPEKKALLFGYFPAESNSADSTVDGSTVFSCLSSDIIAHETTHALLDGLHRRFQEASNPDVPAFHEAFADIVALFQHFTMTELVRFEVGRARGDLSAATLLGGLAKQFGEGSSRRGPLRNYLDPKMAQLTYQTTLQPHDRGSLLVFAIYEAFLRVVAFRTSSTLRMATNGSGILAPGALHPEVVNRLTEEICAAAADVLQMCIRALDYCPAVDITFGEYLRAVITADRDLVPDDRYRHRVAFLEAFRKRGILPRDVRTFSEETLAWGTLDDAQPAWLNQVMRVIDLRWGQDLDRSEIFKLNEKNRLRVWDELRTVFAADPSLYAQFGLMPNLPRYNNRADAIHTPDPGQSTYEVFSVRPARRVARDGSFRTEVIAVIHQRRPVPLDGKDVKKGFFWFRGGATLIIDPRPGKEEIRYSILKNTASQNREQRQHSYTEMGLRSPSRALYFGSEDFGEPFALMHADHGDPSHD
jgi:subtilisin family serine protease